MLMEDGGLEVSHLVWRCGVFDRKILVWRFNLSFFVIRVHAARPIAPPKKLIEYSTLKATAEQTTSFFSFMKLSLFIERLE